MTKGEAHAYNQGVLCALMLARYTASRLNADRGWKPAREGAADALDEFATAGEALLIQRSDGESSAVPPRDGPKPSRGGGAAKAAEISASG